MPQVSELTEFDENLRGEFIESLPPSFALHSDITYQKDDVLHPLDLI